MRTPMKPGRMKSDSRREKRLHRQWSAATIVALVGISLLSATGCVSASEGRRMRQDIDSMDARLTEISASLSDDRQRLTDLLLTAESDITQLQAALDEAAQLLQRNSSDLGLQLDELSTEVDSLRGEVEHTNFRLNQFQEQLNLFMEDIDLRLSSDRR